MNYSDSERVASVLGEIGYTYTENPENADLYLFNTCSIRQKGEDRVYGQFKNLGLQKKENPNLLIGITGCMVRKSGTHITPGSQQDDLFKLLPDLDFVFRITDLERLTQLIQEARSPRRKKTDEEPLEAQETHSCQNADHNRTDYLKIKPSYSSAFQAIVPIQIGCDKYCTYCIVPYSRGREQSRNPDQIFKECEELVEKGFKEITLVGQTVNSYGKSRLDAQNIAFKGQEDPFVSLLERLETLHEKGLNRLRFTSPYPSESSDLLIEAHKKLKILTPSIHLPVQAGDDTTLKRMNRRYTVDEYRQIIGKIRKILPACSITTDIIVGFCGETDEQFQNTLELFNEIRWDMAFLARYSPRRGTVSVKAFQDDVSRHEKGQRWHRLNEILKNCSYEYHKSLENKELEVLVESYNKVTGECEGKCRENKVVQFPGSPDLIGKITKVKGKKAMNWLIKGELK